MDNRKILEYTLVIVSVVAVLLLAWDFTTRDARLCRQVLEGLVRGSPRAERLIDWENFVALGFDVGVFYRRIPEELQRSKYRRDFIRNFATGFHYVKGDFKKFTNWRVLKKKGTKVIVGADYLLYNKTILFTLSKLGRTKLTAIDWNESNNEIQPVPTPSLPAKETP